MNRRRSRAFGSPPVPRDPPPPPPAGPAPPPPSLVALISRATRIGGAISSARRRAWRRIDRNAPLTFPSSRIGMPIGGRYGGRLGFGASGAGGYGGTGIITVEANTAEVPQRVPPPYE